MINEVYILKFKVRENQIINFKFFNNNKDFDFTMNGIHNLPINSYSSFDNTFTIQSFLNSAMFSSFFKNLEEIDFYKYFEIVSFFKADYNDLDIETKEFLNKHSKQK